MSYNQSNRSEKIETTQYRKTDRRSSSSNQQRSSSGPYGKGGGGPAPSPSYNSSNSRSYKKNSNNAQGGQSRAHVPTASVNSSANSSANSSTALDSSATTNAAAAYTPRTTTAAVQNGSHVHPQLHGAADAPVTSAAAKPAEPPAPAAAVQRSTRPVPKAPTSQSSAMSSDPAAASKTPVKAPGDASKPYPFQFGSISPGFMNGMQACHDSFRPPPPLPIPTAPKQQFPRKDAVAAEQSNTGEAHSVPKVKKDVLVSPAPPANQPQKPPVLPPMGGMSMPMQYHQPQVSVQFGGPNQQLQSQGWQSICFNPKFAFSGPGAGYISSSSGVFGTVEGATTGVGVAPSTVPKTSEGVSSTQQSLSNVSGGTPDATELKSDTVLEASYSVSSEIYGARIIVDTLETVHQAKLDKSSSQDEELVNETVGKDEQGENSLPAGSTQVINSSEISSEPISLKSSEFNKEVKQSGHDSGLKVVSDEVLTIETAQKQLDEPMSHHAEIDGTTDNLEILNSTDLGSSDVGSSHGEKSSTVDASLSRSDSIASNEIGTMSGTSDQ